LDAISYSPISTSISYTTPFDLLIQLSKILSIAQVGRRGVYFYS